MAIGKKSKLLFLAWLISFPIALVLGVVSAKGILQSVRYGEPSLEVDLSRRSDWLSVPFRVWGKGRYNLFISTVNHDSTHVGAPFAGNFEVAVVDPSGRVLFQQVYPPGSIEHRLPQNYGDTALKTLEIEDWPLRRWTLKARVLVPDSRFKTGQSVIKFWKQRYDPGMGGLIYFVLIIPAGFFLLVAALCAAAIARGGSKIPIVITLIGASGYLWLFLTR
jgi:hypothetical protein